MYYINSPGLTKFQGTLILIYQLKSSLQNIANLRILIILNKYFLELTFKLKINLIMSFNLDVFCGFATYTQYTVMTTDLLCLHIYEVQVAALFFYTVAILFLYVLFSD